MKRILAFLVVSIFCLTNPATGRENYRQEIMQHVVDPCYTKLANRPGGLAEQISTKEAVELMKIFGKDAIEAVMRETIPLVSKMSFKERKQVYSFSRQLCIKSGS